MWEEKCYSAAPHRGRTTLYDFHMPYVEGDNPEEMSPLICLGMGSWMRTLWMQ